MTLATGWPALSITILILLAGASAPRPPWAQFERFVAERSQPNATANLIQLLNDVLQGGSDAGSAEGPTVVIHDALEPPVVQHIMGVSPVKARDACVNPPLLCCSAQHAAGLLHVCMPRVRMKSCA